MSDFIEQQIIEAIKKLLESQVNEILRKSDYNIPEIEIGSSGYGNTVDPVILSCPR